MSPTGVVSRVARRQAWRERPGLRRCQCANAQDVKVQDANARSDQFQSACAPPVIASHPPRASSSAPSKDDDGQKFLEYQQDLGSRGMKQQSREDMVGLLVQVGSTAEEGLDVASQDAIYVHTTLWRLYNEHMRRMLSDEVWCGAFAKAAAALGSKRGQRVLIVGVGSCAAAIAAARTGCEVVWAERVGKMAQLATMVAAANGVAARISVVRVAGWEQLSDLAKEVRFDVVLTEEMCAHPNSNPSHHPQASSLPSPSPSPALSPSPSPAPAPAP
jgi:hypothetical protein